MDSTTAISTMSTMLVAKPSATIAKNRMEPPTIPTTSIEKKVGSEKNGCSTRG